MNVRNYQTKTLRHTLQELSYYISESATRGETLEIADSAYQRNEFTFKRALNKVMSPGYVRAIF